MQVIYIISPFYMKRISSVIILIFGLVCTTMAQTTVTITDIDNWKYTELDPYVGQTIRFSTPMYVTNNYNSLTISPRRIFSPTNQAYPLSDAYNSLLTANRYGNITLNGVSGYHRLGERILNLTVKVNSRNNVSYVSGTWSGNTRAELEKGYDENIVNIRGEASIIVCCMNLEYYLVENLGTGYGPDNYSEHQKQRAKVSKALAKINADIYGFVEIEQGQSALAELASDLTRNTGRTFKYINDGGSASSSYTKAGYVYCSDVVSPYGNLRSNNEGVNNRKKTQAFTEKRTGEKFLLSINHFKAKSGKGTGDNADKDDGQGTYNGDRVKEAKSVLSYYEKDRAYFGDNDILIMGDLNAYAMEDPITELKKGGMIDLHRAFHADSSYSYVYRGQAGYLDHALSNQTLYPQITGMVAYHINSDESDQYTYDKSSDLTMFRCSDHDPIIVGLNLDSTLTYTPEEVIEDVQVYYSTDIPYIRNAQGGAYMLYQMDGQKITHEPINIYTSEAPILKLRKGIYIINIYAQDKCLKTKIIIQ